MSTLLLTNIKSLVGIQPSEITHLRGAQMSEIRSIENAWLLAKDGRIADFGKMEDLNADIRNQAPELDSKDRFVLPSWCDSHTHLVFASSREEEFVLKIQGKTYQEIAAKGGGILNSAQKLRLADEDQLFESAWSRLDEVIRLGTGAIEIKSGYGLSEDAELKMLRVIRKLKESSPIPVKSTFLGAHAYPLEYKADHKGYIDLLVNRIIPRVADENLAEYVDVFCETGFFSLEETATILDVARKYGLKPKIHVNQLSVSGGVQLGVKHEAISVDHLEMMDTSAIEALSATNTIATLLPGCSFFLGIPFADAKALLNANAAVALASDFNPGSAPSGNMNLVVALACIIMKMLPQEAVNAATLNGAAAMELSDQLGSITREKTANLIITKQIPSIDYLPYAFGSNLIEHVLVNGRVY